MPRTAQHERPAMRTRDRCRVLIGVHVLDGADRVRATLDALWLRGATPSNVVLLADSPDRETLDALDTLGHIRQTRAAAPVGAAAMFNQLVEDPRADLFVFLESG